MRQHAYIGRIVHFRVGHTQHTDDSPDAWWGLDGRCHAKQLGAGDKVTVLSDGNAEFTEKLGLSFDGSGFGLGTRNLRYAMVVDDGKVAAMEVEESPGTCSVTSGSKLLEQLS